MERIKLDIKNKYETVRNSINVVLNSIQSSVLLVKDATSFDSLKIDIIGKFDNIMNGVGDGTLHDVRKWISQQIEALDPKIGQIENLIVAPAAVASPAIVVAPTPAVVVASPAVEVASPAVAVASPAPTVVVGGKKTRLHRSRRYRRTTKKYIKRTGRKHK